jgi:predicted nucleic acid-binding protein
MIVFDTDIVTLLTYGKTDKLKARLAAVDDNEQLAVAITTYIEIIRPRCDSISKAASAAEMEKATRGFRASKEVLDAFLILHHTEESYRRFEELMNAKKGKKRKKDRSDMMVASIALANNALLVTRNTDDYKGINGLTVENWAD